MNEALKDNILKTLAMGESHNKSRAMITYPSDCLRFIPPKWGKKKIGINKTYVARLFHKERQQKHDSI